MFRRIALGALLLTACSRCAREPSGFEKPYLTEPPPLPSPTFDQNGCLTQDQIRALNESMQLARAWELGALDVIERRCGMDLRAGEFPDAGYAR